MHEWQPLRLPDFTRPRDTLMWTPTALDLARITAAARTTAHEHDANLIDVGAGTGLLARLLSENDLTVAAIDPTEMDGARPETIGRYFPVQPHRVQDVKQPFDLALVSWMEAGRDYRAAVAASATTIFQARDKRGGCGVRGQTGYDAFGRVLALTWEGPDYEDVAHALRTRGRGPHGRALPPPDGLGNVMELWTRPEDAHAIRNAAENARAGPELPWEPEMHALGLIG